MRPAILSLAALALLGLVASTATAASPHGVQVSTTLVAHHGSHGHGWSYGYHGPRVIRPPVYGHPPVVVPFPGHPPVVHPPVQRVYRYYGYPYGPRPCPYPRTSFSYHGSGFGFSIGF